MKCEKCGADLSPGAFECPFCKTHTALGVQAHEQHVAQQAIHHQWAAAHQHHARLNDTANLQKTASLAFVWALVGMFLGCALFPPVVGLIFALKARKMARSLQVAVPGKATAALVMSVVSMVLVAAFIVEVQIDSEHKAERADSRKVALEKIIGDKATASVLDRSVACALAEQKLLKDGFEDSSGPYIEAFECLGRLSATAFEASLEDVRFKKTSTKPPSLVTMCFKRGGTWYVSDIRKEGKCGDPTTAPDAASTGARRSDAR